jgi:alpha-1,3-glucosyltransferase
MWKLVTSKKLSTKQEDPVKDLEMMYSARVACNASHLAGISSGTFAYHHINVYKQDEENRLIQIYKCKIDIKNGALVKGDVVMTLKITPRHNIVEVLGNDLNEFVFKPRPKVAVKIIDENIILLFFHEPDKNKLLDSLAVASRKKDRLSDSNTDNTNDDIRRQIPETLPPPNTSANSLQHNHHPNQVVNQVVDNHLYQQLTENINKSTNINIEKERDAQIPWLPYLLVALGVSVLKLLLSLPLYHSTDLEVHRHWMALTHHLPLKQWYYDETSLWTLDYPPYFAYFEKFLSYFAFYFDRNILVLQAEPNAAATTLLFQRLSVICSDWVLLYATYSYVSYCYPDAKKSLVTYVLTAVNAALLLVDHLHFQYNGLLLGVLILCLDCGNRKRYVWMAVYYSVLVLMKHLFVYIAPVIGLYLIIHYCDYGRDFSRFLLLVTVAVVHLLLAFAPFISSPSAYYGVDVAMLQQIFQRLFPFGRGLLHAYWAPNAWAIYYFIDKILAIIMKMDGNRTSSGVIGEYPTVLLLNITPSTTLALTLLLTIPALRHLHAHPTQQDNLVKMVLYCSFSSFLFGYHVHEKAILAPLLLLGLVACSCKRLARIFLRMVVVGTFSLFPLFEGENELVIKCLLAVTYTYCCTLLLDVDCTNILDYLLFFSISGSSSHYTLTHSLTHSLTLSLHLQAAFYSLQ